MSQDMRDFKQRCHNQKQKEEKHNAKKRRVHNASFINVREK